VLRKKRTRFVYYDIVIINNNHEYKHYLHLETKQCRCEKKIITNYLKAKIGMLYLYPYFLKYCFQENENTLIVALVVSLWMEKNAFTTFVLIENQNCVI